MKYLLDTCVIAELLKKRPNPGVVQWFGSHEEISLHLSVVTLGEIQKGISKLADLHRQQLLQEWLQTKVVERFDGRILPLDPEVMFVWGQILGQEERHGIILPVVDMLIAATAIAHNMQVVSRNVHDFQRCHAGVVDPWN
ncbi:MAG: type II toxin-antitoxin system VapC family toxin [Thermaerobacter sp.]|nr:type II toxin-antitoxin system VapC family toxin [Thermaerobacter sp.]